MSGNDENHPFNETNEHQTIESINLTDTEEREYAELLKRDKFWDEVIFAIYDSKYIAVIVAMLAMLLAYHLTIAPHQASFDHTELSSVNLGDLRPVLSDHEQSILQTRLLFGETHVRLPYPNDDLIHFKFQQHADTSGHFRLPSMFYQGVTFGITWQNPHDLYFTRKNTLGYKEMKHDFMNMHPKPSALMKRVATYVNDTDIVEEGMAIYFAYTDLEKQGKLSSDKLMPYKRVLEDVLVIARNYKQVYIMAWYPHQFGRDLQAEELKGDENDKYKHYSIIQQIIPTRTGLNGIKSTAAVWLSAVNQTEPQNFEILKTNRW